MANPLLSLAVPIPNATLSLPGQASGLSAGWTLGGGAGCTLSGVLASAHRRFQRIVVPAGASLSLTSPASTDGVLVGSYAGPWLLALVARVVATTPGTSSLILSARVKHLNGGVAVFTSAYLIGHTGATAGNDWELLSGTTSTVPSVWGRAAIVDISIVATAGTGTWTVDLGLVATGAFSADSATLDLLHPPIVQGSSCGTSSPSIKGASFPHASGILRDDFFRAPTRMVLRLSGVTDAVRQGVDQVYLQNRGSILSQSDGVGPLLGSGYDVLVMPNISAWPPAMICSFDSEPKWDLEGIYAEPVRWTGTLSLTERLA
jgi:hypothetical protein